MCVYMYNNIERPYKLLHVSDYDVFFSFLQANFPEVSDSELKGMDGKIAELQKKVEQSQAECRQLESRKILR